MEGIRPVTKKPISSAFPVGGEPSGHRALESDHQDWGRVVRPTWGPEGAVIYNGQLGEGAMHFRKSENSLSIAKIDFGTKVRLVSGDCDQLANV